MSSLRLPQEYLLSKGHIYSFEETPGIVLFFRSPDANDF